MNSYKTKRRFEHRLHGNRSGHHNTEPKNMKCNLTKWTTRTPPRKVQKWEQTQVLRKGKHFLLHMQHPSGYSCYKPGDKSSMRFGLDGGGGGINYTFAEFWFIAGFSKLGVNKKRVVYEYHSVIITRCCWYNCTLIKSVYSLMLIIINKWRYVFFSTYI